MHMPANVNYKIFPYWLWLGWEIIKSSLDVTLRVWGVKPVSPVMKEIGTLQQTETGYAVYGNSITLTPGTVTVDIDAVNKKIIVHALSPKAMNDLETGKMDRKVAAIINGKS